MSTAPEYSIATVGDFLKVPPERMADCLAEFAHCLRTMHLIAAVAALTSNRPETDTTAEIKPLFIWRDDGKREGTIEIVTP